MDIKYWIYILDEPDTFSVVDMIEHTGTAYLPQMDEMKQGDIVFIATLEYGARLLYRLSISRLDAWIADDGEVFCDAMAEQSMEISDALQLDKFPSLEVGEEGDEYPHPLDIVTASEIDDVFEELMQTSIDAISDEEYQLKRKIIYDALANE